MLSEMDQHRANHDQEDEEEALSAEADICQRVERCQAALPPEPQAEEVSSTIALRLPGGARASRRFKGTDTVGDVFNFASSQAGLPYPCDLVVGQDVFTPRPENTTRQLSSCPALCGRVLINVQPRPSSMDDSRVIVVDSDQEQSVAH